jgi:hypothetical protein
MLMTRVQAARMRLRETLAQIVEERKAMAWMKACGETESVINVSRMHLGLLRLIARRQREEWRAAMALEGAQMLLWRRSCGEEVAR